MNNVCKKVFGSKVRTYRVGVSAADVLGVPVIGVTAAPQEAGGSLVTGTYNMKVVAVNAYGRSVASSVASQAVDDSNDETAVAMALDAVSGATHYDLYFSTDADPKFLQRITEAERASGINISTTQTTLTPGAVLFGDVGTGLQAGTTAAVGTGYVMPSGVEPVNCDGAEYVDFDLAFTSSGDAAANALVVVPFYKNDTTGTWFQGSVFTAEFGGASDEYGALLQRCRVECRGNTAMHLVVASIANGTVSIYATKS